MTNAVEKIFKFILENLIIILVTIMVIAAAIMVSRELVINHAISLENNIDQSIQTISIAQKQRVDALNSMVDSIIDYTDYESTTLRQLTEARAKAVAGDTDGAKALISAVAENYPTLQASTQYESYMTNLTLFENIIRQNRETYAQDRKRYMNYTQKFPWKNILNSTNYEIKQYDPMEFADAIADAPKDLFDNKRNGD